MGAEGSTLSVDVTDDLTGRGESTGAATYSLEDRVGIAEASNFAWVLSDRGGPFPVVVVADDSGLVLHLIELDDSGLAPIRADADFPRIGHTAYWINQGMESGEYSITSVLPIDSKIPTYCQDTSEVVPLSFEPGSDVIADWVAFAIAAHQADESDVLADRRALARHADEVASAISLTDPVTGLGSSVWNTDVIDQALRGVPEEEWELIPTVPVFVDAGTLKWSEEGHRGVVFAEAGTRRLLGWFDYSGYRLGDPAIEPDTLEIMTPPNGGNVEVHIVASSPDIACLRDAGVPLLTIPFDDFAGSGRAQIDLDDSAYVRWSDDG